MLVLGASPLTVPVVVTRVSVARCGDCHNCRIRYRDYLRMLRSYCVHNARSIHLTATEQVRWFLFHRSRTHNSGTDGSRKSSEGPTPRSGGGGEKLNGFCRASAMHIRDYIYTHRRLKDTRRVCVSICPSVTRLY